MNSLFCRHNRFTADCPICSKGTLLDPSRGGRAARVPRGTDSAGGGRSGARRRPAQPSGPFAGPYVAVGPYERDGGGRYEVRLEKVPGGVRLAEWTGGQLSRRAPVLAGPDVPGLVRAARERALLPERDLRALVDAVERPGEAAVARLGEAAIEPPRDAGDGLHGASPGRAGDMRDELRVEDVGEGMVRVARWSFRPGTGWLLADAPTLYPAGRYAQALAGAARLGLLGDSAPAPA